MSTEKCLYDFASSMKLPCRHIFALRKELKEPLFDVNLCDKRWSKDYYLQSHRIFQPAKCSSIEDSSECDNGVASLTLDESEPCKRKVLSQHEKYRKVFGLAQKLASVASEVSRDLFYRRLASLQDILEAWQQGRDIKLDSEQKPSMNEDLDCSNTISIGKENDQKMELLHESSDPENLQTANGGAHDSSYPENVKTADGAGLGSKS